MYKFITYTLSGLLILSLGACNPTPRERTQSLAEDGYLPNQTLPYSVNQHWQNFNTDVRIQNDEAAQVADRLVKLATQIQGVNDATAVVINRWAVVGIDVDAELDRSRVGTLKYSVAEALRTDPIGAYAIVTADPDTTYRLRQMGEEIRNGQPLGGIMEELAAIVGRLMPQIPQTVDQPEDPNRKQQQEIKRKLNPENK